MPFNSTLGAFSSFGYKSVDLNIQPAQYTQIQTITTSAALGGIGLSGDGTRLAIGVAGSNDAYIYVKSGGVFVLEQSFLSSTAGYGRSVALNYDGTYFAVSSRQYSTGNNIQFEIYTRSGSTWSLQQTVTFPVPSTNGDAVSEMVFSYNADYLILTSGGGIGYIYERSGTTWTQNGAEAALSLAVDINDAGDIAIFRRQQNADVRVYTRSGSTWSLFKTISLTGSGTFNAAISGDGNYIYFGDNVYYPVLDYTSSTTSSYNSNTFEISKDSNYVYSILKSVYERSGNTFNYFTSMPTSPTVGTQVAFNFFDVDYTGSLFAGAAIYSGFSNNTVFIIEKQ